MSSSRVYYHLKKDQLRQQYYDRKNKQQECDALYEKYGGEEAYYCNYFRNKQWVVSDKNKLEKDLKT